ncbi:uncharacterized protein TRUGW13939_07627 [Talaromyces rugulosus]|uniref:PNPLA domain-containing protein n=1 Tax=Talaromyces rugulosus TaxID=121627 RepID=A0A7H8R2C4_TALRU|nr:uncharacterized protein TRUGW13939_07627 [Talaromyces rugulosus]QKX60482.1 hypothetical protein TRUGW13939_07627 [Talaromyces rugulosus]
MKLVTEDASWLRVIYKDGFWLQNTGRLSNLLQGLPNPDSQTPQLLHFVGQAAKDKAIRAVFPDSFQRRTSMSSLYDLRVVDSTASSCAPLLLADCNPFTAPVQDELSTESKNHLLEVKWPATSRHIVNVLLARLTFPFSDLICIFVEDFSDLREVAIQLIGWAKAAQSSSLPSSNRPNVILIWSESASTQQQIEDYISGPDWTEIGDMYTLLPPFYQNKSKNQGNMPLKNVLLSHLQEINERRNQNGTRLSCSHFAAFFRLALEHVAKTASDPFDFIAATRADNLLEGAFVGHIINFLRLSLALDVSYYDMASFIASAILMDAYPPNMHRFPPSEVFHSLYMPFCSQAASQVANGEDAVTIPTLIETHFCRLFGELATGDRTSAQVHSDNLSLRSRVWSLMRSNHTCLFCIRRKPEEHVLTCGHTICDQCARIYGQESKEADQRFVVSFCILCKVSARVVASLTPPTANLSILSIDGGGTRGVIPLEFLRAMQDLIETPLVDLFDLSGGTSSGLIMMGWNVHQCSHVFDKLARRVFHRSPWVSGQFWNFFTGLLRCIISDGVYDANTMAQTLMDILGSDRPMFGYTKGYSGKKVLITATDTENSSTLVFATYNGNAAVGRYEFVHHEDVTNEPLVWKIGQATSAAPGLYAPVEMDVPLKRTLQDGGLGGHNNPTLLCLLERRRLLSFHVSGYVLSLGTGKRMNRKDDHPNKTQRNDISQWLHNHAVFRMGRSLGRCVDGDQVASRLFDVKVSRFNIELCGPLRISDTAGMTALRKKAREGLTRSSQVFEETTNALVERLDPLSRQLSNRRIGPFETTG